MNPTQIQIHNILRFADVCLDFSTLPSGLIAIVGENGAGKSTLLDAIAATLYRRFPSRTGELVDYARGRDALLMTAFILDGHLYKATVNINADSRTTSATLEREGRLLTDGKVTTYDAAIVELLPPWNVFLASAFASQNKTGSFLTLDRKGRRDLFATLLGLDRLETMAQRARAAETEADKEHARLAGARDILAAATSNAAAEELDQKEQELISVEAAARIALEVAERQIDYAKARLAGQMDAKAKYRAVTATLAGLESAAGREKERSRFALASKQTAQETYELEARECRKASDAKVKELETRVSNNQMLIQQADAVAAAEKRLLDIMEQLTEQRNAETEYRIAIERLTEDYSTCIARVNIHKHTQAKLDRVRLDAEVAGRVPCRGAGEFGQCQFLVRAKAALNEMPILEREVEAHAPALQELDSIRRALEAAKSAADDVRTEIGQLEADEQKHKALAGRRPMLDAAHERVAELTSQIAEVKQQTTRTLETLKDRLERCWIDADRQVAEYVAALATLSAEIQDLSAEAGALASASTEIATLNTALQTLDRKRDAERDAISRVATAKESLTQARDTLRERINELRQTEQQIARVRQDQSEWQVLAKVLGREGIQALEIDAAGPTVSGYCNELLDVCFGPRFTVDLVTQETKASGKGQKEVFELKVYDNEHGGDPRDVNDLSGGEKTIVDEALKSAIAIFVRKRGSQQIRTLFRDETTGALDSANAMRYVAMLRKVMDLAGFDRTFFITHNADAALAADARLVVADGNVTIDA